LQAEQQAALFYSALSDSFQPGPERDFFVRLAAEEDEHARHLQNLTNGMPTPVCPL
jgi:rubrerythrin